jgi:hypothetical protein
VLIDIPVEKPMPSLNGFAAIEFRGNMVAIVFQANSSSSFTLSRGWLRVILNASWGYSKTLMSSFSAMRHVHRGRLGEGIIKLL